MNIPNRKLSEPIPRRLRITKDGKLKRIDGHSMKEFLLAVYNKFSSSSSCEINPDGTIDVCICTVKNMEVIEHDALMHRGRGA
jgi:hypothetical protein